MNISAQFGDPQAIISNITERFDPNKACLFWNGISASSNVKQKQYEQKIAKALKASKPDKLEQDLEKITLQHEHKQRGKHYIATLEAVKALQKELKNRHYQLKHFVFCETSYLHRHNRLVVDELKGLEMEAAGEEAIKCFGKPWEEEANAAMRVLFEHSDNYQVDYWKDWLKTEKAEKYIQKTKKEYDSNEDFKKVVDQAASDKLGSKNVNAHALQNSIAYILEEAAKVWGLQEEFSDYNLIVAYPGNLPPAVHYLMDHKDCNFIYLKIEFSGRLTVQKRGKLVEPKAAVDTDSIEVSQSTKAVVARTNETQYSPIQQLLYAINDLPISDYYKNRLRSYAVKGMLENEPSSPKELWELGKLFFEHKADAIMEPINTTVLRQALIATLNNKPESVVNEQSQYSQKPESSTAHNKLERRHHVSGRIKNWLLSKPNQNFPTQSSKVISR